MIRSINKLVCVSAVLILNQSKVYIDVQERPFSCIQRTVVVYQSAIASNKTYKCIKSSLI